MNKKRIRLTTGSVVIATLLLTVKKATVEYLTSYMTYDRFAALVIFSALTVAITVTAMTVLVITKEALTKVMASTGLNEPWAWGAMVCARASALCATIAATYDLVTSTPQTVWGNVIEWGACLFMLYGAQNAILKTESIQGIE